MMGAGYGFAMLGMGFLLVGGPLLLIALVVAGVLLWRNAGEDGSNRVRQTLADRFARGEIDEQEYLHRLELIGRR
jgi:putative membrane protein